MAKPYHQAVLLGDSLFQASSDLNNGFSFQGALQSKFIRRLDIVNRGFSGYNTANVLKLMPDFFEPPRTGGPKIDYLLVLLGANDAVRPLPTTSQHVPIDQFKENLIKIITHPTIKLHDPKILLITPPPLNEIRVTKLDLANGHLEATRHARISAAYSQVVRDVAKEVSGVVLVDLYKAIMDKAVAMTPGFYGLGPVLGSPEADVQGGLTELLTDGLHMSGKAYEVFYETVVPHIGAEWQGLADDDFTGRVFPDWRELNPPC